MNHDDLIYRNRVALFAHAERVGVSQACRDFGIHRSTYYRWRPRVKQWGVDALRPRERAQAADAEPGPGLDGGTDCCLRPWLPRVWTSTDSC
jgi:hypothetical protein